jgi:zinc finger CCHC domain-containing protein 8
VEEKICVLDTSIAHRREGSRERPMECDSCESGVGHLGEGTSLSLHISLGEQEEWQRLEDSQLFFVDVYGSTNYWDWQMGIGAISYEGLNSVEVLGERSEEYSATEESRCFNCGSPVHFLSSCPKPRDTPLINLSRQIAAFFRDDEVNQVTQRIHVVEGWRQQRLKWMACFDPGEIKGPLLREALGIGRGDVGNDVPWLKTMLFWGYPKGWTGGTDPKEKMRGRILGEVDDSLHAAQKGSESSMVIYSGDGPDEKIDLNVLSLQNKPTTEKPVSDDAAAKWYRWASYPDSYFLYTHLPIYSGQTLPPLEHDESTTFIISSSAMEDRYICRTGSFESPPPPAISPPPLPPLSPPLPLDLEDDQPDMDLSE